MKCLFFGVVVLVTAYRVGVWRAQKKASSDKRL